MYSEKLERLRRAKGLTHRQWSDASGVSLDTISLIIHPDHSGKYSPKVNTLEDLCKPLDVALWEVFYVGDHDLPAMASELAALRAERDVLRSDNATLLATAQALKEKIDQLKDELIDTHRHYNNLGSNNK